MGGHDTLLDMFLAFSETEAEIIRQVETEPIFGDGGLSSSFYCFCLRFSNIKPGKGVVEAPKEGLKMQYVTVAKGQLKTGFLLNETTGLVQ